MRPPSLVSSQRNASWTTSSTSPVAEAGPAAAPELAGDALDLGNLNVNRPVEHRPQLLDQGQPRIGFGPACTRAWSSLYLSEGLRNFRLLRAQCPRRSVIYR